MTAKKGESALGRGLDALIRREQSEKEAPVKKSVKKKTTKSKTSKAKRSPQPPKTTEDPNKIIVENVIMEVRKNPRISLWSARSAAVLRYLKNTKPAFSISKEASALIEEAVQQKYPEIWEMFEEENF